MYPGVFQYHHPLNMYTYHIYICICTCKHICVYMYIYMVQLVPPKPGNGVVGVVLLSISNCQWNWSHTYMHICTYICTLHMADARLFWLKARPYARCEVPDKKAAECAFG